jgi:bacterioferritin-associated ferredoxin
MRAVFAGLLFLMILVFISFGCSPCTSGSGCVKSFVEIREHSGYTAACRACHTHVRECLSDAPNSMEQGIMVLFFWCRVIKHGA